jgi:hypothetical protein
LKQLTPRAARTRAIIVPHLFGNPADIGAIAELGNANNIVVMTMPRSSWGDDRWSTGGELR